MKTYNVRSRYGTLYKADLVDKNTIHLHTDEANYVSVGGDDKISFIDPEGGPFIALFETASDCIHKDLPNKEIVEINYCEQNKCYVIKLDPTTKQKRKVKVTETKTLKSKSLYKRANRN